MNPTQCKASWCCHHQTTTTTTQGGRPECPQMCWDHKYHDGTDKGEVEEEEFVGPVSAAEGYSGRQFSRLTTNKLHKQPPFSSMAHTTIYSMK